MYQTLLFLYIICLLLAHTNEKTNQSLFETILWNVCCMMIFLIQQPWPWLWIVYLLHVIITTSNHNIAFSIKNTTWLFLFPKIWTSVKKHFTFFTGPNTIQMLLLTIKWFALYFYLITQLVTEWVTMTPKKSTYQNIVYYVHLLSCKCIKDIAVTLVR